MKYYLNQTLEKIPPSGIRKFFEIVAEMPEVISLSVGEPDFDTPWHIREAAIYALEKGYTHYTGNRGTPELRQAITDYLRRRYAAHYDPATEILVTNGGSEAADIAFRACLNPGDEVLLPTPNYVMYAPLIQLAGGVPVSVPASQKTWKVTVADLTRRLSSRTKALVLNYPSNPTGVSFTQAELVRIADFATKHDLLIFSDEIYAELTYLGRHTAFAALPGQHQRTITISGLSKAWAMTGSRIGYLAAPEPIVSAALKIHQYAALCASSLGQAAALEALLSGDAEVEKMRAEYALRRDFVVREFNRMGLTTPNPTGAFYCFLNVKNRTGLTGDEFALQLLKRQQVAVVPGSAFGEGCQDFVRVSYATGLAELTTALERIESFVQSCK